MKKIIIAATLIVIVVIGSLFLIKSPSSNSLAIGKSYTIVLSEEGYLPANITIKVGDSITFKTKLDKPFWPASDIHPTHGIYPEFDPKDAILPSKTWTYKFEKSGKWRYHDHLYPYFTGEIKVTE